MRRGYTANSDTGGTVDRMTSDAEFRMLLMLNTMDLNQEGSLSSEDRLFMAPTSQQQQSQVRSRM